MKKPKMNSERKGKLPNRMLPCKSFVTKTARSRSASKIRTNVEKNKDPS